MSTISITTITTRSGYLVGFACYQITFGQVSPYYKYVMYLEYQRIKFKFKLVFVFVFCTVALQMWIITLEHFNRAEIIIPIYLHCPIHTLMYVHELLYIMLLTSLWSYSTYENMVSQVAGSPSSSAEVPMSRLNMTLYVRLIDGAGK